MSPDLTVIKESKEAEEDRSFWKVLIIALLGAALALLSFFLFNKFLLEGNLVRLLGSGLFAILFFSLFILQVFFTKSRGKIFFLAFLQALAPIFIFYQKLLPQPSLILIIGFLIFFLFLSGAAVKGQREISDSLNIRFFRVAKSILPRAASGFLIVLSLILYLSYSVWGSVSENLAKRLVDGALASSEPIVKLVLTEVSFSNTVDEFFKTIARSQLRKVKGEADFEFQRLPPAEKETIINEVSLELKKQIEKTTGPLASNLQVKDEVYRIIKNYVESLSATTKSALILVVAILFFFTARGVAFLLYWLPEFIAFVLFKFLLITGFAYISLESRSREFIMLS